MYHLDNPIQMLHNFQLLEYEQMNVLDHQIIQQYLYLRIYNFLHRYPKYKNIHKKNLLLLSTDSKFLSTKYILKVDK